MLLLYRATKINPLLDLNCCSNTLYCKGKQATIYFNNDKTRYRTD